ncbi:MULTISPECIES: deoxynucleoside kinase [Aerococcus]|jgi:deoxyadenosine/deoxycytidine kinase|uniref:Deoxynucleoside kinase n=1 Tax=Aerococcus agrisoli TaxID=2487350 RepID=A0A3N4GCV0_9LACT|nr:MULTISPECIES: deoxynucleoside kinase [Aerococcus]OYQ66544.1 deoxynucleoside kinase [Aerococcus sp. 1KP-2016]RPA56400.1 deoxynucleoside kinase [Aerococcus agrisoli]
MVMLTVGGMIGLGKTTITNIIRDELGFTPFYESVDDNIMLPYFYKATPEEQQLKRYPFLTQLDFLNSRFKTIKQASRQPMTVLDRSIFEDWYFARVNTDIGRISEEEFSIYENLSKNMMEELAELPRKHPDLMIYLHGSFDTVMTRIESRGRDFEQGDELTAYYHRLWAGYDNWVKNQYTQSNVLYIDMDKYDLVKYPEHKAEIVTLLRDYLVTNEIVDVDALKQTV